MQSPLDARAPVAFFANGIGDHLLNLPALRALDRLYPGRLRLICTAGLDEVLLAELAADRLALEYRSGEGCRDFDVSRAAAFARGCDLFLSLNPWHSGSVRELLAELDGACSIGLFEGFSRQLPLDYAKHTSELAFDIVRAIEPSARIEAFDAPPRLPERAHRAARRILADAPAGTLLLAVHLDTHPSKMLPPAAWSAFFEVFLAERPEFLVLVLGTRPQALAAGAASERLVPCHGLPLECSLALVAAADLFAGVDSCLLHAADAFRVPGIGAFVSTDPREFGFRLAAHRHVLVQPEDEAGCARALLQAARELAALGAASPRPDGRMLVEGAAR